MYNNLSNNKPFGGPPNNTALRVQKQSATTAARRRALLVGNKGTVKGYKSQTQYESRELTYIPLISDVSGLNNVPVMFKEAISMITAFRLLISHVFVRRRNSKPERVQRLMITSPLEVVWSFFFSPSQTKALTKELEEAQIGADVITALQDSEKDRLDLFSRTVTEITTYSLVDKKARAQRRFVERTVMSEDASDAIKKTIPDCKRDVTISLAAGEERKPVISDPEKLNTLEPQFEFVFSPVGAKDRFEMYNGVEYRVSTSYSLGTLSASCLIPFGKILADALDATMKFLATDLTSFKKEHGITSKAPPFALQKALMVLGTVIKVPENWCELTASTMEDILDDAQYFSELTEPGPLTTLPPHTLSFTWRMALNRTAYYVSEQMMLVYENETMVSKSFKYLGASHIDSRKFITTSRASRVVPRSITKLRTQLDNSCQANAIQAHTLSTLSQSAFELNAPTQSAFSTDMECSALIASDQKGALELFHNGQETAMKKGILGAHLIYEQLLDLKYSPWSFEITELTDEPPLQRVLAALFSSAINSELEILSTDDLDSVPDEILDKIKAIPQIGEDVYGHYGRLLNNV